VPEWEPVIGLEIHVQLKTRTKMFCSCESGFGGEPNTRTCPVCLAFPGALPVPNEAAVEWTIKLGHALNCRIAERAIFHRKNYFYPDNPKGYQISQYDEPLCVDGSFVVPGPEGDGEVGIVRAHLEEDAAKTIHVGGATGRIVGSAHSNVDFNRGGTPLVEIVTQPDLRSAARRSASCSCCGRPSSSSASRMRRCRRARCAPTQTCPYARWGRRVTERAPS